MKGGEMYNSIPAVAIKLTSERVNPHFRHIHIPQQETIFKIPQPISIFNKQGVMFSNSWSHGSRSKRADVTAAVPPISNNNR